MKQNHIKILKRLRDLKLKEKDHYPEFHNLKKIIKNRQDFESCLVLEALEFVNMDVSENGQYGNITKKGMIFLEFK